MTCVSIHQCTPPSELGKLNPTLLDYLNTSDPRSRPKTDDTVFLETFSSP